MKIRSAISAALLALGMLLALVSAAGAGSKTAKDSSSSAPAAAATNSTQDENLHLEGEKRFRSNCGRCHLAPPKFAPRMMATIVRHMRVRANITDEDMRLVLRYMTE
jgi:cytochrome c5